MCDDLKLTSSRYMTSNTFHMPNKILLKIVYHSFATIIADMQKRT